MTNGVKAAAQEGAKGALLAGTGLVSAVLVSFLKALGGQIGRLQAPGDPPVAFARLHGAHPTVALDAWRAGQRSLATLFQPARPEVLLRIHAGVAVVLTLLLASLAFLAIDRFDLPSWLRPLTSVLAFAGVLGAALDVALSLDRGLPWFHVVFTILFWAKAVGIVGALLVVAVDRIDGLRAARARYRDAPAAARLILFAAIGFAVLMHSSDIGAQCEDLLRRELAQGFPAVARLLLELSVYLAVVVIVSRITLSAAGPPSTGKLAGYGAGLLAFGAAVRLLGGMTGPLVLGVLVLVIAGSSAMLEQPDPSTEGSGAALYALAAILPAAALAMLAGRLFAGEVSTRGDLPVLLGLTVLGALLLALGGAAAWWCLQPPADPVTSDDEATFLQSRKDRFSARWYANGPLVLLALGPICVALLGLARPGLVPAIGRVLSSFGVLLMGLTAFAAVGGTVRLLFADWDRPAIVAHLKMTRTPVVGLLLVWFLGTTAVGARFEHADKSPHLVRTVPATTKQSQDCLDARLATALSPRPHEAAVAHLLCSWLYANARVPEGGEVGSPVPLVLVTASGGGVRAAVWTARVLDCLFLPSPATVGMDPCGGGRIGVRATNPLRYVFAAGGASGGSVGIMSTVAQTLAPTEAKGDWVRALGGDHVGPLLSQAVLGELLLSPFGLAPGHDRAEVLMDGWATSFGKVRANTCPQLGDRSLNDIGFLELQALCPNQVPLLMFNSTVVGTGQRFNVSALDGSAATKDEQPSSWAGGSVDLRDVLCPGDDIRLIDAAFLSARFPFATPSGRIVKAGPGCARDVRSGVDLVDGGYLENSGAGQIGELYDVLAPLLQNYNASKPPGYTPVKVVLVRIENGERSGAPTQEPHLGSNLAEPLRVPEAKLGIMTGAGQSQTAMEGLLTAVHRDDAQVMEFALYAHPGRLLPLGWALTPSIFTDIDSVFQLKPNQDGATAFAKATTQP